MANVQQAQQAQGADVAVRNRQQMDSLLHSERNKQDLQKKLGDHADAFAVSLLDLYSNDSMLQKCEPALVLKEALKAAAMELPINKALGFGYIIPYGNQPTFVLGYRGLIQMAMRTGAYRHLNADVVYDGELEYGDPLSGEIRINRSKRKPNAKVIGYFAYFQLLNGFSKTLYMSVEDVAAHAKKYSKTLSKVSLETLIENGKNDTVYESVGWVGNFRSMAIKTTMRNLISKYGMMTIQNQVFADAIASDIEVDEVEERNITIAAQAASEEVNITEAEIVDEETGEVINAGEQGGAINFPQ